MVFSVSQAILAARAGAGYVSPFVGRLDDIGEDGVKLVEDISKVFEKYNIETKIIAASIRNVDHVENVAKAGADISTVPFKILKDMVKHPLTDAGIEKFLEDWKNSQLNKEC